MLAKPALVRALAPHMFVAQTVAPDLFMVRKSDLVGLYERVEFHVAGRKNEVIVVGLAITVVWNVVNQMRGLLERGGLPEVCPTADSAKVYLTTTDEAETWAARVADFAPTRATALAHEHGPLLLRTTESAREVATAAFLKFVEPASDPRSIQEEASPEQKKTIDNALSRPYAIPSKELASAATVAVAALVRMNDPDVVALGSVATTPARDPQARIDQMRAVSRVAIWKVRLLIDLIGQPERNVSAW